MLDTIAWLQQLILRKEEISKFSRRDAETYRTMITEWKDVASYFSKAGRSMFVAHYATTEPPEFKVDGGTLAVVGSGIAQTPERQLRIENDFHQGTVISEIRSPLNLERYNSHNWHGSCHGGDLGPSQSETLRTVPGYAQHRLPHEEVNTSVSNIICSSQETF